MSSPETIDETTAMPGPARFYKALAMDESDCVRGLITRARLTPGQQKQTEELARRLVHAVRAGRRPTGGVDAFMNEYSLSSEEGVVLMCLAEALLRIPDADTADKLIADKIGGRHWDEHLGKSDSLFVNASTWGLMLTGQLVGTGDAPVKDAGGYLKRLVGRSGEPIIRQAMRHAMRIMGKQFVLGRSIDEAMSVAAPAREQGYRFSFDMLGEAAVTEIDAKRYFQSYLDALKTVGREAGKMAPGGIFERPSISVKLSALHPRYEAAKEARARAELLPRVVALAEAARDAEIGLTIDAEEVDRLELSLGLFGELCAMKSLAGWDGLGLAVQAYGKRALPVLEWLGELARATGRRLPVRLVKGAYWDTEIKLAQEQGFDFYPVFTRKASTDVSYLACAKYMLGAGAEFYPQFATHNAHSLAAIMVLAGDNKNFEFQRLHGMGQPLYEEVVGADKLNVPCRIYAPVGSHEDLLAYLVRRLLENGANTSFVNRLADDEAPIRDIIADPMDEVSALASIPNPHIPMPAEIFAPRRNSAGLALWDETARATLQKRMDAAPSGHAAGPLVSGKPSAGAGKPAPVTAPYDRRQTVGHIAEASDGDIDQALNAATAGQHGWDRAGGAGRADCLERAASLYEAHMPELMSLIVREAGKTLANALGDIREAVDFLRYYAARARAEFDHPTLLPGPTGERNELRLHGRGVFACISPWNFPLAIFTGQVSAALAAGNSVIAKPAEQTPLIAWRAVQLMHKAGVPGDVLHLLPGDGARVGAALVGDRRISGIAFTGSNDTARAINRGLAARDGAIIPLIAETGGQNVMIVDSTALTEQAVKDVVMSAFDSAGQRCSAARVLCIQDDVADRTIAMLKGAMAELAIGDPSDYATDVGPVIDEDAKARLEKHKTRMAGEAETLVDLTLAKDCADGTFVAPAAYLLTDLSVLRQEVFGPVLHVIRYRADRLDQLCEAVNDTGFGLTLGIHTRIEKTAEDIRRKVRVGNIYVNRNQVGAVVGAQPFGGEGLSGTGPKAGGPHYLHRFATERVTSTDITASGGNAALMSLGADRQFGDNSD